ncbi:MAG: GNAT family N-acetyltransferase [Faecousia sp.]
MELVSNYMDNAELRHKLNALTRKTFGFDFENWVTGGYFEGDYIPYSWMEDGKIISNVSANRMCFLQKGEVKNYIQIGTVMTDPDYRNRGLAKRLMEYVVKDYEGSCDGIYLFGDLSALDFYRKTGFQEGLQYQYVLKKPLPGDPGKKAFSPVDQTDPGMKRRYMQAVRRSAANASLEQMNKFGLQMFYTANMRDVYYAEDLDCFAVMDMEGDTLMLQSIICKDRVPMEEILVRLGTPYRHLKLGFSPLAEDAHLFQGEPFDGGEDYRLFYRGKTLDSIAKDKLFFPLMSHA